MTIHDLQNIIESFGYPVTFHHFNHPVSPPFLIWNEDNSQNVNADLTILRPIDPYALDFYYETWKERKSLEALLTKSTVPWQRVETDTWIDAEKIYRSSYEIDL